MLKKNTVSRWYPSDSGYVIKWPYDGSEPPSEGFRIEPKGWDHEHCDACNRTISLGSRVWLTLRGSFYVLCRYCHRRMVQLTNIE